MPVLLHCRGDAFAGSQCNNIMTLNLQGVNFDS